LPLTSQLGFFCQKCDPIEATERKVVPGLLASEGLLAAWEALSDESAGECERRGPAPLRQRQPFARHPMCLLDAIVGIPLPIKECQGITLFEGGPQLGRTVANAGTRLLAGVVVLFLAFLPSVAAEKKMRPLSREAITQVWLGLSEDSLYLYRLDLKDDGTGLGGYVFTDQEPTLFRIASWSYEQGNIVISPAPPESESSSLRLLRGRVVGMEMKLTVSGHGWRYSVLLRREGDLEPQWRRLREAMRQDLGPAE